MLIVLTLLLASICAGPVSALYKKTIVHGNYLTLDLPERTYKLEFASADESEEYTIWENKFWSKASKGHVSTVNQGWKFEIRYVTYDEAGTYTLRNAFGSTISSHVVKVVVNTDVIERIPGETLSIQLGGLKKHETTLRFYSNYSSETLVENGVPVANSHSEYFNRIKVTGNSFQVLNVNVSDCGRYVLTDHKGRVASNNTMILVDSHPFSPGTGLIALMLLGIPGGICFCCRRRICKRCRTNKSYTDTNNPQSVPVSVPCSNTVTDPGYIAGYPPQPDQAQIHYPPPPGYNGQPAVPPNPGYIAGYPPQPDQGQIHYPPAQPAVPPNPGFQPGFVPQNPVYPPESGPLAPPPQWNAPPTQYNPSAPVNYTPVMNSAPAGPETTGLNMSELPPNAPLLTPQPEHHQSSLGGVSMDILNSSDTGVQFDINKGKSSGNSFL